MANCLNNTGDSGSSTTIMPSLVDKEIIMYCPLSRVPFSRLGLLLLALLACAVLTSAQQAIPVAVSAPLSRMLPSSVPVVVSADVNWWWHNFATVRALPDAKAGLDLAEITLGISFDKDLLPCFGQLGFGLLVDDKPGATPHQLLLLEIRNREAFNAILPGLSTKLEALTGSKWLPTNADGVSLRYADPNHDGNTVAWGQFGGWLVIGVGGGAIRESIEAWKGKIPALADNAAWAKSVAQLPNRPVLFGGVNGTPLVGLLNSVTPMMGVKPMDSAEMANQIAQLKGMISIAALTDADDGLRGESIECYGPALQAIMANARKGFLPIDETALAQLPAGTFAACLTSNLAKMKESLLQTLAKTTLPAGSKKELNDFLQHNKAALDLLNHCTGAFGFAGAWTAEHGFGLAAISETPTPEKATGMVNALSAYLTATFPKLPISVQDGVASLPDIPGLEQAGWQLQICWTAKKAWFRAASNPTLLHSAGQTTLQLPPEAAGASDVFLADMGFLAPFLTQLKTTNEKNVWIDALLGMGLDKVQIVGYSTIAEDGSSAHSVCALHHLSAQVLIDDLTKLAQLAQTTAADHTKTNENVKHEGGGTPL
jgi:hypothetical protein